MQYEHTHSLLPPDAVEMVKRALTASDAAYSSGASYISATALIGEPLQRQLRLRHGREVTLDVTEGTWALFGSALHTVLELGEGPGDLHERRFFTWHPTWGEEEESQCCSAPTETSGEDEDTGEPISVACTKCKRDCSWVVSGQADLLTADGVLYDFKCSSAWAFRLEDGAVKAEWEGQLNVLAHLIRHHHWYYTKDHDKVDCPNGLTVKAARILAFIRDFSPTQCERNTEECKRSGEQPDYPLLPIHAVEAPLWTPSSADSFFDQRLRVHSRYDGVGVKTIPECSPGQRWHKGDVWAVYKLTKDNKKPARATKLFHSDRGQSDKDAWALADALKNEDKDAIVESRPGEDTKCAHYCGMRSVCPYGRPRAVASRLADHAKEREALGFSVKRW
jgi:hypothetical protein